MARCKAIQSSTSNLFTSLLLRRAITDLCASKSSTVLSICQREPDSSVGKLRWDSYRSASRWLGCFISSEEIVDRSSESICDLQDIFGTRVALVVLYVAQKTFTDTASFSQLVLRQCPGLSDFTDAVANTWHCFLLGPFKSVTASFTIYKQNKFSSAIDNEFAIYARVLLSSYFAANEVFIWRMDWDQKRAADHIDRKLADVEKVVIKDYVRDMSLENIKTNEAYKVDAAHIYVDIVNLDGILGTTATEGVTSHKRALRFLNQHYRAVSRILTETETKRIDFHNQRIHAVVTKPYNTEDKAEKSRVQRAVAVAQLIIDVLTETGDDDEQVPSAQVRVGIDSGKALAVNNGRNGYREPLFLGRAGEPCGEACKQRDSGRDLPY